MKIKHISSYKCEKYKEFEARTDRYIRNNQQAQFRLGWCMEIDLKELKHGR